MEERKKGRRINLRKHCSSKDNMNAYCVLPKPSSQFSNGEQGQKGNCICVWLVNLLSNYQCISPGSQKYVWTWSGCIQWLNDTIFVWSSAKLPHYKVSSHQSVSVLHKPGDPVTRNSKTSPHRLIWWLLNAVYSEARIPSSHVEDGECHTCSH